VEQEERTEFSPVSVQETLAPMARTRRGEEGREFQKQQHWKSRPLGLRKSGRRRAACVGVAARLGQAAVYCRGTAAREATREREGGRGTGWERERRGGGANQTKEGSEH
jgi:hypothetical protein